MDALTREAVVSAGARLRRPMRRLASLLCVLLCSCGGPPPLLPPVDSLATALGCAPRPATTDARDTQEATAQRPQVDVYLDASISMRGFVQQPARDRPGYKRVLQELLG